MGSTSSAPANKHQQRTEETRRKLLKAARRVFARDGFEAARIEEIAKDAGHTRGAFYANFDTKEDLFFALLEQQFGEHLSKIQGLFEKCSTEQQRLAAIREYYVGRSSDRQWSMLMLEFKLFAVRHGQLRPKLLKAHRRIRASLRATKIHILGETLDATEPIRRALEATLHGLVLEHAYDSAAISEKHVVAYLRRIFDVLVQHKEEDGV
jgi:AcrR family transcriptional regulator